MRTEAPLPADERRRVELTVACRDADAIPKVANAGEVFESDGRRLQVMHNGVLVEEGSYYGSWMTEVIARLRGHHEPQEEAAFHAAVERLRATEAESPTMIELGSFWAYYALWFGRALPGAECYLVEPDPAHLDAGRRNLTLNGASARFVQAAVGRPHGQVSPFACESDGIVRDVQRVSVDGLMESEGIDRVALLLCDAQGAELEALRGAERALSERRVRFIVLSTHHHAISGDPLMHERCLELLRHHDAHVIAEHTVSESFSGDGLIVVSLDERDRDLHVPLSRASARDSLFGAPEYELAGALARQASLEADLRALRADHEALLVERSGGGLRGWLRRLVGRG